MVLSLGADEVIDYTQEDFTRGDRRYDVILDLVGNHPPLALRRVLEPEGIAVLVGGGGPDDGRWIGPLIGPLKGLILSPFVDQEFATLLASLNQQDLTMEAGQVTPVIDRRYPLNDIAEAVRYLETGRARGKVIITLDQTPFRRPRPSSTPDAAGNTVPVPEP